MLGTEEKGEVKKAAAQLIQGMMKGMDVGTFNFTNLLICIYEADQDAELVYAVTQIEQDAIKDKSIIEGAMGVFFAYGAYQTFMSQVLPACEQVDKSGMDLSKYDTIVSDLWNYDTRLHVEGEDVVFNGQKNYLRFDHRF
jgi:hypothetical protein